MIYADQSLMVDAWNYIQSSDGNPRYLYNLEITTPDNKTTRVTRVISYDEVRNFVKAHFDEQTISFTIGLGTWLHYILPYRNNLRATIIKTPLSTTNNGRNPTSEDIIYRGKLHVEDTDNLAVEAGNEVTLDAREANRHYLHTVTCTFIDDTVKTLRTARVSGWFNRTNMWDLLHGLYMSFGVVKVPTKEQYLAGNFEGVVGVSMVPPDDNRVYTHTYLKKGTQISKLASYLQDLYGIYNYAINSYYTNGLWYVYPLTNMSRYETTERRVNFYNYPKEKGMGMDVTYAYKGKELNVICTGDMKVIDESERNQYNKGNAVVMMNAANVMDNYLNIDEQGRLVADVDTNITIGTAENRDDGVYNFTDGMSVTTNLAAEYSKMNASLVSEYLIEWQSANPSLLRPGMPCRIYYVKNNETLHIDGIVAGVDSQASQPGSSTTSEGAVCNAAIRIIGERV